MGTGPQRARDNAGDEERTALGAGEIRADGGPTAGSPARSPMASSTPYGWSAADRSAQQSTAGDPTQARRGKGADARRKPGSVVVDARRKPGGARADARRKPGGARSRRAAQARRGQEADARRKPGGVVVDGGRPGESPRRKRRADRPRARPDKQQTDRP